MAARPGPSMPPGRQKGEQRNLGWRPPGSLEAKGKDHGRQREDVGKRRKNGLATGLPRSSEYPVCTPVAGHSAGPVWLVRVLPSFPFTWPVCLVMYLPAAVGTSGYQTPGRCWESEMRGACSCSQEVHSLMRDKGPCRWRLALVGGLGKVRRRPSSDQRARRASGPKPRKRGRASQTGGQRKGSPSKRKRFRGH